MERLIDRTMKIVKRGNSILVPVTGEPRFDLAPLRTRLEPHVDLPHRLRDRDPRHEIRERREAPGIPVAQAPRRGDRIGGVLVLPPPAEAHLPARVIAKPFGEV